MLFMGEWVSESRFFLGQKKIFYLRNGAIPNVDCEFKSNVPTSGLKIFRKCQSQTLHHRSTNEHGHIVRQLDVAPETQLRALNNLSLRKAVWRVSSYVRIVVCKRQFIFWKIECLEILIPDLGLNRRRWISTLMIFLPHDPLWVFLPFSSTYSN